MTYLKILFIIALAFITISCGNMAQEAPETKEHTQDSTQQEEERIANTPTIEYELVKVEGSSFLENFLAQLPDSVNKSTAKKIIMTLNRKETRYMRIGDSIVVPKIFTNNILDYSIFPYYYKGTRHIEKLIMVSIDKQAYACYEKGELVRFAAVNSGKERTPSFPGRYALQWKSRLKRSSLDSNWVLPFTFNFHSWAGSAFHKFDMPGRPVSHSCLRQFMDDSEWLYNWGNTSKRDTSGAMIYMSGTPVILLGAFDYTRRRFGPWHDFKSNKDGTVELPEKPLEVEEALIPIIQIPKTSRGSLKNRERYENAEQILRERGIIREGVHLTPTFDFNLSRRKKKEAEAKRKADSMKVIGPRQEVSTEANSEETQDIESPEKAN